MDVFRWIDETLHPGTCDSVELLYDDMASQSFECLPVIYQAFDASRRGHWRDRGAVFDFLNATDGEGKRLLDFGPGDGWPSLVVAPYAAEVIGVEGSRRRAVACQENARRLDVANAEFVHVAPGAALPFADATFDGAMAGTSIEQASDPRAALAELLRVLKPGGRLRIHYEALGRYRGGHERDLGLLPIDGERCRLLLFDRDIERERVTQYGLTYRLPYSALVASFSAGREPVIEDITVAALEALGSSLVDAQACVTQHPSGTTWASWLRTVGFRKVVSTESGLDAAAELFDGTPEAKRPPDMAGVDALVGPVATIACRRPAPLVDDPPITAVK